MFPPKSVETLGEKLAEPFRITSTTATQHTSKSYQKPLNQTTNSNEYKWDIVWKKVFQFLIINIGAVYGVWLALTQAMWSTIIFGYIYGNLTNLSITAGAHRLWTHRAYKAKLPLRIFLMFCQSGALQNDIYEWVRDHRVHHIFTDTDADPHNSRRGFFFSHIGWLMVRKHKDVMIKGKTVDLSDLEADPVVMFQKRYYKQLVLIFSFIIPILSPWYFWGESLWISSYVAGFLRYAYSLHITFLVNSAAHIYGTKPYDKNIKPTENKFVAWAALGEGWHNYHHVFPWDYKAAELGDYGFNLTTGFLDFMAKVGWAYDLKTVTPEMIMKRVQRTGDRNKTNNNSSRMFKGVVDHDHHHIYKDEVPLWGWSDKDMSQEYIDDVIIYNKL